MKKSLYYYFILLGIIISFVTVLIGNNFFIESDIEKTISSDVKIDQLHEKAKQHYYQGNLEKASDIYTKLLSYTNRNDIRNNLITINKQLGNIDQVVRDYRILINNTDNVNYKLELGIYLYQIGKYKKAETVLIQLHNKDDITDIINNRKLSIMYYYLGRIEENLNKSLLAIEYFDLGIKYDKTNVLNFVGKAEVYKKQEEYKKAINNYQQVLDKDYSLSGIYPEIADLYNRLDNVDMAYRYWKKSLDTGRKKNNAKEWIKKLEEDYPYLKEKDKEEKEKKRAKIDWYNIQPLKNTEDELLLKIGLVDDKKSISFQTVNNFKLINKNEGDVILEGESKKEWQIKYENGIFKFYKEEKLMKEVDKNTPFYIESNIFLLYDVVQGEDYFWSTTSDRQYRGKIELYPLDDEKFNVINIVNTQEYLMSVVPSEITAWWPMEALKAQSVAARSYALKHRGRHENEGYDLCDGVHCAAYKGISTENIRTTKAVQETGGEVVTYNNRIIDAVFSSNSGGYSESAMDVWGNSFPYLKGANNMKNGIDFPLEPYKLEDWLFESPPSFSGENVYSGTNKYRWLKIIPVEYLLEKYGLKKLTNIQVLKRGKGGSIESLVIYSDDEEIKLNGYRIRSGLGGLRSNRFIINRIYNQQGKIEKIILYGGGWGHNVGMDQTAAAAMAADGYNYREILEHFYPGTEIEKVEN